MPAVALTAADQAALEAARDRSPSPAVRERAAAILKVAGGMTPHAVAKHGLLKPRDPDTVYFWVKLFTAGGPAALLTRTHGGPRRRKR